MSIKEVSNDVTDMLKVQSDDQSVRISMENLKLKDNQEEYVSRNQYHLVRGQTNQLKVGQFLATESLLKLMKNAFYFTSKPFLFSRYLSFCLDFLVIYQNGFIKK